MSYNDWKEYKLDEIYEITNGLSKKRDEFGFGYPFLTFREVFYNYYLPDSLTELANSTERERERCSIARGDIFLTRTSETQHELGLSSVALKDYPEATFNGFTKRLRAKVDNLITPEFAGFYFRSPSFRNQVTSMSSMTTRASLNNSMLASITLKVPPIGKQKRIAELLYSLTEKMKTNIKINQTLEEIAQAIFDHWFVDFEFPNENGEPYKSSGGKFVESELGMIPEGWELFSLAELTCKFTTGLNPRRNFVLGKGHNYYVTIKNMRNQQIYLDDRCDKVDDDAINIINKRSDLKKGDLLFSGIGTIGRVYLIDEDPINWNISESIFTLRPSSKLISSETLYLILLSNQLQGYAQQLASGSVQRGVRMRDLKSYNIPLPVNGLEKEFTELINPLIKMQKSLVKENEKLTSIRDTLLPKLMSGEIRIPDAEQEVEACLQKSN